MPHASRATVSLFVVMLLVPHAEAQEFTNVQTFTSRVLLAREDAAEEKRASERRRVEELDRRTQQQAVLLGEQAQSVKMLDAQLRTLRDERQLLDIASAFEAAVAAGDLAFARSYLADNVIVAVPGEAGSLALQMASDEFLKMPLITSAKGRVFVHSSQDVQVRDEHATLNSVGRIAGPFSLKRSENAVNRTHRFTFLRTPGGWKIDGIFWPS